jgi:hypothetical protein
MPWRHAKNEKNRKNSEFRDFAEIGSGRRGKSKFLVQKTGLCYKCDVRIWGRNIYFHFLLWNFNWYEINTESSIKSFYSIKCPVKKRSKNLSAWRYAVECSFVATNGSNTVAGSTHLNMQGQCSLRSKRFQT